MTPAPVLAELRVSHRLVVMLLPEENRLTAVDTMDIDTYGQNELIFRLSAFATDITVSIKNKYTKFEFKNGFLRVPIENRKNSKAVRIKVGYRVVFKDSIPIRPIRTDDPGYGVLGTISPRGTMLLPGASWYPRLLRANATYHLTVDAPKGVLSVSAGRSLGYETREERTISRWQVDYPIDGLALAAGRYVVDERTVGNVTIATYFFTENRSLSNGYLVATARYLKLYSYLFGPYPFHKFAVVENFFPTGYGFPSFTLLGGRVLRLPFIIHTSLGHEIAHCWWGNGVYVDPKGGNWSEGLTTYVADYLYKERKSEASAAAYRQQMLRNYTTLVSESVDFPLSRFTSRTDPVTKSIGYDKSAMIFHMVRQKIGNRAFWSALRTLCKTHLFKITSWEDFRRVFETHGKLSLKTFFDQWVYGSGAPQLSLKDVRTSAKEKTYEVSGKIVQDGTLFDLMVPLVLEADTGHTRKLVRVIDSEASFAFTVGTAPKKLIIDPDANLMRRLYPEEIPPSVNSLKGSKSVLLVFADGIPEETAVAADTLLRSLGHTSYRKIAESVMRPEMIKQNDLLVVGYPAHGRLPIPLPPGIVLSRDKVSINEADSTGEDNTFFGVFHHPYANGRVLALLLPFSPRHLQPVARKITHYGRYSYLLFQKQSVKTKGIWTVTESPSVYRWNESAARPKGEGAQ
jgi:hypothetical protein